MSEMVCVSDKSHLLTLVTLLGSDTPDRGLCHPEQRLEEERVEEDRVVEESVEERVGLCLTSVSFFHLRTHERPRRVNILFRTLVLIFSRLHCRRTT